MNRGADREARRRLGLAWLGLGPGLRARDGGRPAVDDAADPAGEPPVAIEGEAGVAASVGDTASLGDAGIVAESAESAWQRLQDEVRGCTACGLAASRRQTVFGVGARTAPLMIIGEAPGAEEDARGEPFVGQAGRLLDLMLAEIGLARGADVFICNVLKCRPPGNRNPAPDEVAACSGYLERQVRLVRPRAVLLLGSFAVRAILQTEASVGSQRGQVHRRTIAGVDLPIVVSYHPAYLLRNPADKRKSWEDLLRLGDALAEAVTAAAPAAASQASAAS